MGKVSPNGFSQASGNLATLCETFKGCGFIFQHNPKSRVSFMRWLALTPTYIEYVTPQGETMIESGVQLVANGATIGELIDRLSVCEARTPS